MDRIFILVLVSALWIPIELLSFTAREQTILPVPALLGVVAVGLFVAVYTTIVDILAPGGPFRA
jgi:hypothetical protein